MRPVHALLALNLALAAPAMAQTQVRKLAIVVGNNAGSGELAPLRYAEADAGKMARVLVELSDVAPDDLMLLQGRGVADLERAFQVVRERSAGATSTVLVFYFSGHSDGESLELGKDAVSFTQLRALLDGSKATVRLAIIDACSTGSGLRMRGGKPSAAFSIRANDALNTRGEVFISSSSPGEVARESREVMGGFFTHHFVTGLRGAADSNADKAITLGEAYRYAYDRTLAVTDLLAGDGQHATFDYRLSGRGELVLSSLVGPPALLVAPAAERVMLTDLSRDQVIAELGASGPRELALAPGRYALIVTRDGQTRSARFTLGAGATWKPEWEELAAPKSAVAVRAR